MTYCRFLNISNRPDRVAQLAEHWASIPKVVGSIPTVNRHIFQAYPVWIYTQSNITSISISKVINNPFRQFFVLPCPMPDNFTRVGQGNSLATSKII